MCWKSVYKLCPPIPLGSVFNIPSHWAQGGGRSIIPGTNQIFAWPFKPEGCGSPQLSFLSILFQGTLGLAPPEGYYTPVAGRDQFVPAPFPCGQR